MVKRILHIISGMNRGGIETWLMHVLRHIDRDRFHMDFLVHTTQPCPYDDEARALGGKIIPCLHPSQPLTYARNFKRILRECGHYDIVHSHVHHYSGYCLRLAKQAGVPIRIAHSHNDTSSVQAQAGWLRRLYYALMQQWIFQYATSGLGCSQEAAADLFGQNWQTDSRWQILYYGIDLTPFKDSVDAIAIRTQLGIPADAFVIGHVGRFAEQKNHVFLVEIASEVVKKEPKMRLLLIGDGKLRSVIEQKVAQLGLTDHVIFAGIRSDIPRLMLGAMDVFILPSLHEGLPVVGIEAQAAGLPFILSDVITPEVDLVNPLLHRISLDKSPKLWAENILKWRENYAKITQNDSLIAIKNSCFNIENSVKILQEIYDD